MLMMKKLKLLYTDLKLSKNERQNLEFHMTRKYGSSINKCMNLLIKYVSYDDRGINGDENDGNSTPFSFHQV